MEGGKKKTQAVGLNNLRRFLSGQIKYNLRQQSKAVWLTEGREGYQGGQLGPLWMTILYIIATYEPGRGLFKAFILLLEVTFIPTYFFS